MQTERYEAFADEASPEHFIMHDSWIGACGSTLLGCLGALHDEMVPSGASMPVRIVVPFNSPVEKERKLQELRALEHVMLRYE